VLEKETSKKPWSNPQIVEIGIIKTEHGGGWGGYDMFLQDDSEEPENTGS